MSRKRFLAAALLLRFAAVSPAAAQSNFVPRDLTRGVSVAGGGGAAGDFDATAVTWNPAGLATLAGYSAAFATTLLDQGDTVRGGGGWGLFLGYPVRIPLPGNPLTLSYGFGFESVLAPDSWTGRQDGSFLRNSVGIGSPAASIGWTVGTFFWTSTPQRDSVSTHHVGLSLRPSRFAAAGLTVRDVFEPVGRDEAEKFTRSYELELIARPLGDWRVEVGVGATRGEDDLTDFRTRVLIRPLTGVALYGGFESVERRFGDIEDMNVPLSRDSRATIGVTIDGLDGLLGRRNPSVAVAYGLMTSSRGPGVYAGSSFLARLSGEEYPPVRDPARIERFVVDQPGSQRDLVSLLLDLERAERATEVSGVLLDLRGDLSWGTAEELRSAVARLRRRGKLVAAYLREGGMTTFHVAAACDRTFLHPSASVRLRGVGVGLVFVPELLDRLGIGVQVVQIGEYKSAAEALVRTSASPEAREQIQAIVDDVDARFVSEVARGRGIAADRVRALLALPSITAREAVALRLADAILHPDELEAALARVLDRRVAIRRRESRQRHPTQWAYPRIAVVHIAGDIVPGDDAPLVFGESAAGDDVAEAIREAREAPDIRAIILRVASPGGLVEPSERIAREVELTRGRKPILVSMGDVAASGGYMVAAHADRVFALPTTVTGSIGVVGVKINLRDLFDRIGVKSEAVKKGIHADADTLFRPWSDAELAGSTRELSSIYDRFVDIVARGRRLSAVSVRKVGGGRIWSGTAARGLGLVDDIGGFLDALERARRAAGVSPRAEIQVIHLPAGPANFVQALLTPQPTAGDAARSRLPPVLGHALRSIPVSLWWGGALVRLPFAAVLD